MGIMTESLMPAREGVLIFVKSPPVTVKIWVLHQLHKVCGFPEVLCFSFTFQLLALIEDIFVMIIYSA